ncbi:putative RNA-binding protein [Cladorrhinum samala]|uniref:RNA-binding protein n=1 Tax=Cladorrhinum samala TaxID=585594 RepID=A0AAV9HUA4_9PEZI|nr:putative RNA-binding protein [Cladorrhinum samala]
MPATTKEDIEPASPEVKKDDKKKSSKKRKTDIEEIEVDLNLPEPPSKKAKRLLKKGKALPPKPADSDASDGENDGSPSKASTDKKKSTEKAERSPYGVWIGNLRFTVTKNELRQWLIDNSGGAITDDLITRVNLPTKKPDTAPGPGPKKPVENRGFAYVDFKTFEANVAAIALSETEWNRRKLLIKDAKSYEGRPEKKEEAEPAPVDLTGSGKTSAKAARNTTAGTSTKIFVGNLSFAVTEDDLREHFAKCGPIRWVKVATFEDTGKCKGYGWVNFEDPEAAQWAVKGFVKVKETIDTVEDFMDVDGEEGPEEEEKGEKEDNGKDDSASVSSSSSSSEDSDSDSEKKKEKKKPAPPKKTTATEAPRIKTRKWWVNQLLGRNLKIELAEDDQTRYQKRFKGKGRGKGTEGGNSGGDAITEVKKERKPQTSKKASGPAYATDINVARLTGAAVAPAGKKTTFE